MYSEQFSIYGDSSASLMSPKGRQELRFRVIDPFLDLEGLKILDYGCGLGYLFDYICKRGFKVDYTGLDIVPEFVNECQRKFPNANFSIINGNEKIEDSYDIVFSSGVFNLKSHTSASKSKTYAFDRIKQLFSLAEEVLICDFLSSFVDFMQPRAQHFTSSEIIDFCFSNLTRRFQLRHDLLPYEMTLYAWKNGSIKHPENVYLVDS